MRKALRLGRILGFVFILIPLAVPIAILSRLVRPWVLIRFGKLTNSRLGHLAANVDVYLAKHLMAARRLPTIDLFYCGYEPTCNQQLLRMWQRLLVISPIFRACDIVSRLLPGRETHRVPIDTDRAPNGEPESFPPFLHFTDEEQVRGMAELAKMGLADGDPFVLIFSRDASYLGKIWAGGYQYHSYRDSFVESFVTAAEALSEAGYWVLRYGSVVAEPFRLSHPQVIDYANCCRDEFMDIYLGANCAFFLGDSSGANIIPVCFRLPVATTNLVPIEMSYLWRGRDLFIPKLHRWRATGKLLRFQEIYAAGAGRFFEAKMFEEAGIELIDNTPDEIRELALEMSARLGGTWRATPEDEELQARFWSEFPHDESNPVIRCRIGAHFLRKYRHLLG